MNNSLRPLILLLPTTPRGGVGRQAVSARVQGQTASAIRQWGLEFESPKSQFNPSTVLPRQDPEEEGGKGTVHKY